MGLLLSRLRRRPAAPSDKDRMAAQDFVDRKVRDNKVVVFSKSYCPYCRASTQLLSEVGAKYHLIELDQVDDGSDIQDALGEISGQKTVPNIFIGREHIGGNSELQAKKKQLRSLLENAGAL